jgi:Immunoglobulin-like domain of bacterial spore germination
MTHVFHVQLKNRYFVSPELWDENAQEDLFPEITQFLGIFLPSSRHSFKFLQTSDRDYNIITNSLFMKNIISWFLILTLIVGVIWFFWSERTLVPEVPNPPIGHSESMEKLPENMSEVPAQMVELTSPLPSQFVTPVTLTGRARGPWYFEASFPVELRDSSNALIVTAVAQAQGEWMTENWVPFIVTLSFPAQPIGSSGTLVLKKDNPSGEPQNDASLVIPVQF